MFVLQKLLHLWETMSFYYLKLRRLSKEQVARPKTVLKDFSCQQHIRICKFSYIAILK